MRWKWTWSARRAASIHCGGKKRPYSENKRVKRGKCSQAYRYFLIPIATIVASRRTLGGSIPVLTPRPTRNSYLFQISVFFEIIYLPSKIGIGISCRVRWSSFTRINYFFTSIHSLGVKYENNNLSIFKNKVEFHFNINGTNYAILILIHAQAKLKI